MHLFYWCCGLISGFFAFDQLNLILSPCKIFIIFAIFKDTRNVLIPGKRMPRNGPSSASWHHGSQIYTPREPEADSKPVFWGKLGQQEQARGRSVLQGLQLLNHRQDPASQCSFFYPRKQPHRAGARGRRISVSSSQPGLQELVPGHAPKLQRNPVSRN